MASGAYADTALLAGIGILDKKFNSAELRRPEYGAFKSFLNKREILVPSADSLRLSDVRPVTAEYLERTNRRDEIYATRTCTPTAAWGDSGEFTLSYTTYSHTVQTAMKVFDNNYYTQAQAFANDLYNMWMDLYQEIECDAITYLDTNRNGLQGNRTLNTWDGVNDIMEVLNADRDNYLNYIKVEMIADNYRGTLQDIHTPNMLAMYRQQFAQGASNDENLKFQFPGFEHYMSNCITNASDHFGTSYIVEDGYTAALDWIPPINRKGEESKAGEIWTTARDPFFGLTWAVFITDGCVDTTYSQGGDPKGSTQDYRRTYEFSIDLSFNHAPITVADETPINKYALLSS